MQARDTSGYVRGQCCNGRGYIHVGQRYFRVCTWTIVVFKKSCIQLTVTYCVTSNMRRIHLKLKQLCACCLLQQYLETVLEKYGVDHGEELSYFELNLETWRQLWRVLEMADVVLLITDIRHPVNYNSQIQFSLFVMLL